MHPAPNTEPKPRDRIVASDTFVPTEYDGHIEFEAWEAEDGSAHRGFTIIVHDQAYDHNVTHRFQVEY